MASALERQVGGNHYKQLIMQPIQLIIGAKCDFTQGCIIKYISRYRNKNGKEDLEKIIQYAELYLELAPEDKHYSNVGLGYTYCKVNDLDYNQTNIIISALQKDYSAVINWTRQIIEKEY